MPNPLSWYFHWAPEWTHRAGVAVNHIAELVAPFGYFFTGALSAIAGLITFLFQAMIMVSGNLSWLNFLTLVLTVVTFDDKWLSFVIPFQIPVLSDPSFPLASVSYGVAIWVAIMSLRPIGNMLSPNQIMNTNYNPLHLVGTYGAFGSITRTRNEVVIEGTEDAVLSSSTVWREYEFKAKPGELSRRPPQMAPYHLRLDWLMWFAAMSDYRQHSWFVPFLTQLLEGNTGMLGLLQTNPFPQKPPRFIRAELYEYHFTTPSEKKNTGHWWKRKWVGHYFPPVTLKNPN